MCVGYAGMQGLGMVKQVCGVWGSSWCMKFGVCEFSETDHSTRNNT